MGLCEQVGLLAQGLGTEDWANLLFIVVMAALWLVAGLFKAMSKKRSHQERPELDGLGGQRPQPGESWQQRLARRAEELQRRLEEEAGLRESRGPQPPAPKTPARPAQAAGGKITVRTGQRGESILVYERPQEQPPVPQEPELARQRQMQEAMAAAGEVPVSPEFEPVAQDASEPMPGGSTPLTAKPRQSLSAGGVQPKTSDGSPASAPGMVIDYSDPEALTKAILQYEILGKPMALRETVDQAWDS